MQVAKNLNSLVTEKLLLGTEPADKISGIPTAASLWIHMKKEKQTKQLKLKPQKENQTVQEIKQAIFSSPQ